MEPQLEGCGKECEYAGPLVGRLPASMEPQLEGCGKQASESTDAASVPLQWSRNLRVAESAGPPACHTPARCGFNGAAT